MLFVHLKKFKVLIGMILDIIHFKFKLIFNCNL